MDSFDAPMLRWPAELERHENDLLAAEHDWINYRKDPERWEREKQRKREILDQMAEREPSPYWLIGCILAALAAWVISAFLIAGLWLLADPLARLIARML